MNIPALDFLVQKCGSYSGEGKNQEGHAFSAKLEMKSRVQANLVELGFRAEDSDKAFHEESTWITNDLVTDKLCLWTVSTNTPGMLRHELSEDSGPTEVYERRFVFQLGKPEDKRVFRQEIALELRRDGSVSYRYSWAVPHEVLEQRTQSTLRKI
ncbi:MAG: hypothetical protein V4692_06860 [Bdellovibrionota bacterium]